MVVTTRNSVYRIQPKGDHFLITKIKEVDAASKYLSVGETRKSSRADLCVGLPAYFDTWHTSAIIGIEDEAAA